MAIKTVQEYQAQEKRLVEIKNLLENMTQKDDVDLAEVVKLRDEADFPKNIRLFYAV